MWQRRCLSRSCVYNGVPLMDYIHSNFSQRSQVLRCGSEGACHDLVCYNGVLYIYCVYSKFTCTEDVVAKVPVTMMCVQRCPAHGLYAHQQQLYTLIERTPPPVGVSYLLCSLIKNCVQEDPPRSTWYKFFEGGPLTHGS